MRAAGGVRHSGGLLLALPGVVLGVAGAALLLGVVLGRPPLRPLGLGCALVGRGGCWAD